MVGAVLFLIAMVGVALGIYALLLPICGALISWTIAGAASVAIYTWVIWGAR